MFWNQLWRAQTGFCQSSGRLWLSLRRLGKVWVVIFLLSVLQVDSVCVWCVLAEATELALSQPLQVTGIANTPSGILLVTCQGTDCICSVQPDTGEVTRIAGSGEQGMKDGAGAVATFGHAVAPVVVASERCMYVSELLNHSIRRVSLPARLFQRTTKFRSQ
jgi:hypothetical protein